MDNTYGEFEGTELDPAFDMDFEDDQQNDLIPILGFSAALAALVGAVLVLVGRLRKDTPQARAQQIAQELADRAGKGGKKGAKAVTKAVKDANLSDLLDEALSRARDVASNVDVGDVASSASKRARKAAKDANLTSLLSDAIGKARDAADNVDRKGIKKAAHSVRKQAQSVASNVSSAAGGMDSSSPEKLLDSLKEKLVQAIDTVRSDLAPKAMDSLKSDVLPAAGAVARHVKEDVMPAAQDAVDKLREDVIPAAQEKAGKLAGDYELGSRAQKASSSARKQASSLSGVMQGLGMALLDKVLKDFLPEAKKAGGKAVQSAREDVIPAAAQSAGDAAQRVKEDVLPRVSEAASQAPDLLADLLKVAREKVELALETVGPIASDALDMGKSRASDAAEFGKHRAQNVAGNVRDTRDGVGGALSSAGKGVGNAVGGAVSATTYATRETTGVLFWLAMLGSMLLLIFVPERDKQSEIWNNVTQFLGEIREMWRDLQGSGYELEGPSDDSNGTT